MEKVLEPNASIMEEGRQPIWSRFFSRQFDVMWETLLIVIGLLIILGLSSPSFLRWLNEEGKGHDYVFTLYSFPLVFVFDALLYKIFKNTPGKALNGISVRTAEGSNLSFFQYLRRNLIVWIEFAFGLPLICFIPMALQSRRLTKGRKTLQDEKNGYVVTRVPPKAFSLSQLCFLIGYISLASSFAYLNQLGENQPISNQQGSTVAQAPSYSWMNPKTKLVATIDGMWTYSAIQNDQKENLYQFQNSNASTVIFFSSENVGASGIGDYVSKFESANASNMKFSDGGVYSDHSGQPSWSTTGTLLTNTEYHFSITVVQNGATFWREVVLQMAPFNFSDSDLMRLESALWSTID